MNAKTELRNQALAISRELDKICMSGFMDGEVNEVLKKGAEPLRLRLQSLYMKGDPTGVGGSVGIHINIVKKKKGKKRGTVYIGPNSGISRGWQLWYILNWGKTNRDGSITPGSRWIDKALMETKNEVISSIKNEYQKLIKRQSTKFK